jgi:hypothetical protein
MQKEFLNGVEKILRDTGLSDKQICNALRGFHMFFPNLSAFFIIFGSKRMFKMALIANILIFIMFNFFGGCILSRLERRFCHEDYTIIDPVLEYMDVPLTNANRHRYSIYSALTCFGFTGLLYYLRFIYKWGRRED